MLCVILLASSMPLWAKSVVESDTLRIRVEGLCGMCKARIEKAALRTKGVKEASWEAESRTLTVLTSFRAQKF